MKNWLLYFVVHYRTLDRERARAIQQCKRNEQSGRSLTVCLLFKKKVKIQATLHVIFPTIHFLFPDDDDSDIDDYDIYGKQFVELALNSVQVSLNNRLATFQAPVSTYTVIIFQTDLHTLTWGSGWENLLKGQSQKKMLPLWKVWTQLSFHKEVDYDCPGQRSRSWIGLLLLTVIQLTLTLKMADYHTGCWNISHCQQQQSYLGLRSPRRSYSTYSCSLWLYHFINKCLSPFLFNNYALILLRENWC